MIKLNDIKVLGISHPNIFMYKKELEGIDIIIDISYVLDKTTINFNEYYLSEDFSDSLLADEFAAYLTVWLEGDRYKNLDDMNLNDLDFMVRCDISNDVDEIQDISKEELNKAFYMLKEYVKSESFLKQLNRKFEI